MIRWCYIFLIYIVQPLLLLVMWKRSLKIPEYRQRLAERYGFYSKQARPKPNGIVIHAASVGEVIATTPLIRAIQVKYPDLPLTVTTVTPTGSARVKEAFGDSVYHFYLPYDLNGAINRFLAFVQPKLFIVIETELWPNLIRKMSQNQIPFIIANARLSPRSAKRYSWIRGSIKNMLNEIELILAQDQVSAERYISLGFPEQHLVNTGNLKFDLEITPALRQIVIEAKKNLQLEHRPVWIAGSTHDGEEKMILEAHRKLLVDYPTLVLILVPRHPERFSQVEELLKKSKISYVRRSDKQPLSAENSVLFGNTMGEMMLLYGLANIAFVGGSLVKHGGHNPLEPIAFELPVISGIHTFNFPEVFSKLRAVNGVIEIPSSVEALIYAVKACLSDLEWRNQIIQAGFDVLKENQGALRHHLVLLSPYIEK